MKNKIQIGHLTVIAFVTAVMLTSCQERQKAENSAVHIVSAMKNVMWQGELEGKVKLDTISEREGLYGLGPLAFLKGEILLLDGEAYVSRINANGTPVVQIEKAAQAPFLFMEMLTIGLFTNHLQVYKI